MADQERLPTSWGLMYNEGRRGQVERVGTQVTPNDAA